MTMKLLRAILSMALGKSPEETPPTPPTQPEAKEAYAAYCRADSCARGLHQFGPFVGPWAAQSGRLSDGRHCEHCGKWDVVDPDSDQELVLVNGALSASAATEAMGGRA